MSMGNEEAGAMRDLHRDELLRAMLPHVGFDGWTGRAVRRALIDLGEDPEDAPLMFPAGAAEMIEAWSDLADRDMVAAARAADLAAYRTSARVRSIIMIRLEQCAPYKEALRRALAILALPTNARLALRLTARTVDSIWHAAGDRSADFNWYTKRALLAAVYSSTLLFWLRDMSEDHQDSIAFLDRRLKDTARITKLRKRLEDRLPKFRRSAPSPSA